MRIGRTWLVQRRCWKALQGLNQGTAVLQCPERKIVNFNPHSTAPKGLAVTALVLASPLSPALEDNKFEALLTPGISRSAVIAVLGAPDREHCRTTVGVHFCHLEWTIGGLLTPTAIHLATLLGELLVAKSNCKGMPCKSEE